MYRATQFDGLSEGYTIRVWRTRGTAISHPFANHRSPLYSSSHTMYLTGIHLICVHLTGVYLTSVHLTGVYLMSVHLTGVHLTGVYLTGVHLTPLGAPVKRLIIPR